MSTYDYEPLQDTAFNLLAKFGQEVVLTRTSRTGYKSSEGGFVSESETQETFIAINQPGTDSAEEPQQIKSERTLVVAARGATLAPKVGDQVAFDSKVWNIGPVTEVNPGGTVLVWRLNVSRV